MSNYTVKNTWEFQHNIVKKIIPDGHVMVSLDVVAMFPNISIKLFKDRLLNTRVEHKNNLGRKCNYHNVLSDHRKEYADHDFDWNVVEILHFESNKRKREFMEMLYIKREGRYSINLKKDLVKYNGCYDSTIGYVRRHCVI